MRFHNFWLPLFTALVLTGCAQFANDDGLYQEPPSPWINEQNNTRLQKMRTLIQSGKGDAAMQEAGVINPSELSLQQLALFHWLSGQSLLSVGEAEQAVVTLAKTEYDQLDANDKVKFLQSQAFAYSLTGNLLAQAKVRVRLDELLTKPVERKKNQAIILESLGLLPDNTVNQLKNPNDPNQGMFAWATIAKVLASKNQTPATFNSALSGWKAENPEHPANLYLADVALLSDNSGQKPQQIALLLPESGPYLDAAKAVKAGFLAAHSRDNSQGNKPQLKFYDTEKGKLSELYQKAVTEGASLVVGPLKKESIQSLASTTNLSVPVLALNYVSGLSKTNLYQFALSPMDDVNEITHKAVLDGHKNALLFVPNNELGKRVAGYFSEYWRILNGKELKKQTYDPKSNDFSNLVKRWGNHKIDDGHYKNPNKPSTTRNPDDPDVLFLSAYSREGRLINSQLNVSSIKIPVYALPSIYAGIDDAAGDSPLNGVAFCDTPWLFNSAYSGDLSMLALSNIWKQFPASYIRLVAMGIDSYHLTSRLTTLAKTPFAGATGNLSLNQDNRIKRNLVCAKFVKGKPEPIGYSASPSLDAGSGKSVDNSFPSTGQ